ncbi:MAG: hypothetical protein JNJ77_12710 [Planctomycetia bacterium]|nr:hypothetical protein [Planctomycetia bacterium]
MEHFTAALQSLHTHLLRIRAVTEELENGPRRVKRSLQKVAAAEKAAQDHQQAIKSLKVNIQDRDVSLKANTEKIKKYKRDLDGISSKKEYDALNIEIASLEKRNSDLEEEALGMMSQVEEMTARIPEFEQAIVKAKEDHARVEAEYQAQLPAWQTRLEEARQVVAQQVEKLPDGWKKTYKRQLLSEGADALAALTGKTCSACNMDVTAQQYAMIAAGNIESCKHCGKILYVSA